MKTSSVSIENRVQKLDDRDTFTAVFRRFYAPLARYACRFTGDEASAADVLQEVFAKLWEDRERITIDVSLKAMLYTMVRNRALNHNRKRRRIASDVTIQDVLEQRPTEPLGEKVLETEDLRQHLYRWIDELPSRRREAFTLSRYHGLRHREIARIMGLSERTVDTHILLALRELRRRLDELQNKGITP